MRTMWKKGWLAVLLAVILILAGCGSRAGTDGLSVSEAQSEAEDGSEEVSSGAEDDESAAALESAAESNDAGDASVSSFSEKADGSSAEGSEEESREKSEEDEQIEELESQIAVLESKVEALSEAQSEAESAEEAAEDTDSGEYSQEVPGEGEVEIVTTVEGDVYEDEYYTDKESVALYLVLYGHLPYNYITKEEARDLGWEGGDLEPYAPGMSIGGSRFGNYEGLLPKASGRKYYECDIDYNGGRRNAKRLVYSNDGLIFYTEDHYSSFEQMY